MTILFAQLGRAEKKHGYQVPVGKNVGY